MTTTAPVSRSARPAQPSLAADLHVARHDITFADAAPGRVAIEVIVHNLGDAPSAPTLATLSAAPFGAFVPWRPLAVLHVPAIAPGDEYVLRTEALRPAPAPLGPPDRVPPRRLLTALGAQDDRPQRPTPILPADLAELVGRRSTYWAGNLNVFVGRQAVERHIVRALRIYPGRVNLAMFVVGDGHANAYRFHITHPGTDWNVTLHDVTEGRTMRFEAREQAPLEEGKWQEVSAMRLMLLSMTPPKECAAGKVEVHVAQRSTGQEAVVEFDLDPGAAGPGCFVV